jgi:aminoacrylate hydrolase
MSEIAGLYWEDHGPREGPPVILSAGLGGSAAYWEPNLAALARRHRVILYDHRGTGRSSRELHPEFSEEDMANDVVTLMDELGIGAATFIGHALGGVVGLTLALLVPERLERLVLVNAFAKPDRHFFNCMDTRMQLLRGSGVVAFVRAQPIFLYPARWIVRNFDGIAAQETDQLAGFQGADNLQARVNILCAFEVAGRLDEIRNPTLLIAAEDDILVTPSCSEVLAEGIAGSTLATMTGGHACNVTEAERFNEIVCGWLSGPPATGVA